MCGFNRKREGDWSDGAVVTNTDRTQQTIELINRIEMLEKKNKALKRQVKILTLELDQVNRQINGFAKLITECTTKTIADIQEVEE